MMPAMAMGANRSYSKLRNLAILALATLVCLQVARLGFVAAFGSLDQLFSGRGLSSLYLGLKFDLRLVTILFAAPWLLLQAGVERPKRPTLAALFLLASLTCYLALVFIGAMDDRRGRFLLLGFLLMALVQHKVFRDFGLASGRAARAIWAGYAVLNIGFVMAAYGTDFGSFSYNRVRLNGTILVFLRDPLISAQMVWQSYPIVRGAIVAGLLLAALLWGLRRLRGWHDLDLPAKWRWLAYGAVTCFLVMLLWGKQSRYPLRWGEAFDGRDRFVAQAALNPVLLFLETRVSQDVDVDMATVRATHQALADYFGIPKAFDANGEPSLLRSIAPRPLVSGTPNVVFIQIEGLSAYKTNMLGNPLNPTPFLQQLAARSLYLERFFVVMENTGRSMFATLFGIPDVSSTEWTASRNPLIVDQNCLINALDGYEKYYFLGGSANWAQIRAALANNIGGLKIFEEGSYRAPIVDVWGVADVDMLLEGGERLAQAQRPYFAYFHTSGDHPPFTIPPHLRDFHVVAKQPAELQAAGFVGNDEYNSVRLMDYSLAKFFAAQEKSPEFLNTVYVLWADHGIGRGNTDPRFAAVPLSIQHIPAMIFAPGFIKQGRRIAAIGSQLDILPTVMSLLGRETRTQTLGKDMLDPRYAGIAGAFTFSTWQRPAVLGFIHDQHYFIRNPDGKSFLYDLREPREIDHSAEQPQLAAHLSQLTLGFYSWSRYLMERNKLLVQPRGRADK